MGAGALVVRATSLLFLVDFVRHGAFLCSSTSRACGASKDVLEATGDAGNENNSAHGRYQTLVLLLRPYQKTECQPCVLGYHDKPGKSRASCWGLVELSGRAVANCIGGKLETPAAPRQE